MAQQNARTTADISNLVNWISRQLDDEKIFPAVGAFPKNFKDVVRMHAGCVHFFFCFSFFSTRSQRYALQSMTLQLFALVRFYDSSLDDYCCFLQPNVFFCCFLAVEKDSVAHVSCLRTSLPLALGQDQSAW